MKTLEHHGRRTWRDHELRKGVWIALATGPDKTEVTFRQHTHIGKPVRLTIRGAPTTIEYVAIALTENGPAVEYLLNGFEKSETDQYDITLDWS